MNADHVHSNFSRNRKKFKADGYSAIACLKQYLSPFSKVKAVSDQFFMINY